MDPADPYRWLRPRAATPDDDLCRCADEPPIVLQDHLSDNPLSCLRCNLEVPPERVGLDALLCERVARWRSFHRAFYTLWLDSGDFEDWAREALADPRSPVNARGLELVAALSVRRRAFLWLFEDDEEVEAPARCPRCDGDLSLVLGKRVCEACAIVVPRA